MCIFMYALKKGKPGRELGGSSSESQSASVETDRLTLSPVLREVEQAEGTDTQRDLKGLLSLEGCLGNWSPRRP